VLADAEKGEETFTRCVYMFLLKYRRRVNKDREYIKNYYAFNYRVEVP
jgi:hypothetical protein